MSVRERKTGQGQEVTVLKGKGLEGVKEQGEEGVSAMDKGGKWTEEVCVLRHH